MIKKFVCALALAATATAANAETLSIKTSDLDLSTEAGVKKLDKRIDSAARRVCKAYESNTGSRLMPAGTSECIKRASAEAKQRFAALSTRPAS